MRDIYLYEECDVLKNLLNIKDKKLLYEAEGKVFGIGCKIFTIAGPVILYGIFTSWVLGYWVLKMTGVV